MGAPLAPLEFWFDGPVRARGPTVVEGLTRVPQVAIEVVVLEVADEATCEGRELGGVVTLLIGRGPILVPGNLFWCFGFCLVFEGPRFGVPFGIFGFSCPMESLIPMQ